ncbi:uncharacterized protein A4U43_C09F4930 [Asparagus officinalis]|uniref:Uncharacterized protein n=1 Tax=Asparagus officinalis TaxID=4686 RepID=A0A5P1E5M6_ASPOF|nr:uncharacterized protein A4U43_C09F4930 [Asparagus officinalis]
MQNPNHNFYPSTSHPPEISDPSASGGKWAAKLLGECAKAIADKDSGLIQHYLWMLNELASPYGDCDQKLASHFLQALFCKPTGFRRRCYKTLRRRGESHSFESRWKVILKFQGSEPVDNFRHVASMARLGGLGVGG